MAKKKRRKMHGLGDLVWDIADDVKDLVKDEFESQTRGKGRDRGKGGSSKAGEDEDTRRSREQTEQMDDLRLAIQALSAKVDDLSREK
jgi:hypothetical protein